MEARPENPDDAQRDKESPGRAGAFKESFKPPKDQGALDTPILFQRTNQARRGSLNRPDPPRLSHDGPGLATTPAARGAMTGAILQKMQRLASVSGFVIGTSSPVQRPPAARLCPASPDRGSHQAPGRQAPSPAPATAGPRQAGDEARTDGIGDAREHGADAAAAELAFPVYKIPISAAIEGRGAQAMVVLVLRPTLGRIRASHPHSGGNRRWTC
jgi:hypothetical protein